MAKIRITEGSPLTIQVIADGGGEPETLRSKKVEFQTGIRVFSERRDGVEVLIGLVDVPAGPEPSPEARPETQQQV